MNVGELIDALGKFDLTDNAMIDVNGDDELIESVYFDPTTGVVLTSTVMTEEVEDND